MDLLGFKQLFHGEDSTQYFEVLVNNASLGDMYKKAWINESPKNDQASADLIEQYIPHECVDFYPVNPKQTADDFLKDSTEMLVGLTAYDAIVLHTTGVFNLAITICGCGEWMCDCTSAQVCLDSKTIIWDKFLWFKDRKLDVGPFTFDHHQYCEAIDKMHKEAKALRRS